MSPQSDASSTSPAAFPASASSAERTSLSPAQEEEILQLASRIAMLGRDHMSFLLGNSAARTSAPMRDAQLNALISAAIATTTSLATRDNTDTRTRTQSRDKSSSTRPEDNSS
ncbi:hypothetical protein GQ607_015650 [Colletotrichum asianum]|uniref:Uncharacterized protein n=1 Tax=Colletotrichum asianum TaxID=702518 RepID=A0A8H3W2N2_9PEZI|nr:hypothetical protein GQ607_015650 [Colletotrichum asianum]